MKDRLKEAMEEMGQRIKESLDRIIFQAVSGTGPDLNGDQFSPGCFGVDIGTNDSIGFTWTWEHRRPDLDIGFGSHTIRPKSVTKPGLTYDEFMKAVRKIKR